MLENESVAPSVADIPKEIVLESSPGFAAWLHDQRLSLAISTYEMGRLILLGVDRTRGCLAVSEQAVPRCMGLAARGGSLWVGSHWQVWRFENLLPPGQWFEGCDRLYGPRTSWVTGGLDMHDLAVEGSGRVVFANTRFSCVSAVSASHSFETVWIPPWVSSLAAGDRAHLNGLALKEGVATYVTAVGRTDEKEGWRSCREKGGVVYDIVRGEAVCEGLAMPHSPRWHEGRLWLLEAGRGWFGRVDERSGSFERLVFCPGFARGLSFHGRYAVVGVSQPRNKAFTGLPLQQELEKYGVEARCGILVIDLQRMEVVYRCFVLEGFGEIYDVLALPGVERPRAIGFHSDEIQRFVSIENELPVEIDPKNRPE